MNSSAAPRSVVSQPAQQHRANVCGCDSPRGCPPNANESTAEQSLNNIPGRIGNWNCIRTAQRVERNATSQTPSSPRTFSGMYEQSTLTRTSDAYVNISEPETFSRIEQRYGDLRHLHLAANVIQKAYRNHVLNKSFLDLRNRRQQHTSSAGDEQEAQDADGTLTLTLHRISDWHNDGTLRPAERTDVETVGNTTAEHQRCNDCSRGNDASVRVSASRLAQPAKTSEAPGGGDRSPVWVRKPLAAPRPDSRGALESDADGDADCDIDVEDEGLSSRVVLRTAKWIEDVRPAHGRERDRMAESVRTERERERERERRPLSFGAPSVGSRDCECEECHMARRVAQLGIFFGCDARPSSALSSNGNCHSFPAAVNSAMRRPEAERARKRLYRVALNLFNRQPEAGVQFLVAAGFVRDEPRAVARFLLVRRGLARSAIGEFLGVALRNAAVNEVLMAVANAYRFAEKPIDVALRRFQAAFQLTGEAQRIQHVVESFARAYAMQNQTQLASWRTPNRADLVQLVALACVMLNTDLHSPSVRADRKMKPEEFVRNLSGLDDGADLDRASLLAIYERIRAEPLATSPDHVAHVRKLESLVIGLGGARPLSEQRRKSSAAALLGRQSKTPETIAGAYRFEAAKLAVPYRRLVCYCRLFELADSHVRKLVTAGTIRLTEHGRARSSSLQSVRADDDDDAAAAPIALRSLAAQREHAASVSLSDSLKREVFLFNDSLLVSKLNSKAKSRTKKDRAVTYTFRQLASLVNARVSLFECPQAPFGVCLILPANDMYCGKSGTDLFVMGASSAPARSSTVWYDDSTPNTTPAPAQDVTVLAFTAKSAADRQKFCEDLVESIVETRTLRRILTRLAEGTSPAELARCYVEPPSESRLNDLAHAQRSLDDNGVGTRRGSEPMHHFNLPIRNVASNSNLSNTSSAYGSHATGSVSRHSGSRPLSSACAPPTDGAVLRHTPILSVSSTSSSSLVSVGTLSTASNDGWQPHADASSNQSGASRHSAFDAPPRLTPPSGSSVTPDKDPPHLLVHQHRAHAQAHSTASAPPNAHGLQLDANCARRNLQFVATTGRVAHAGPVPRRPNDDITFFAENRDYLTMPDAPANRIANESARLSRTEIELATAARRTRRRVCCSNTILR